ncbi:MAG: N-acetylmuramoyl-L-alanine amidase [Acidobacteriota bacterium]
MAAVVQFFTVRTATQGTASASAYVLYLGGEDKRTLPFRTVSGIDRVSLTQLATIFNLTLAEDALTGGLTVKGRGQTILLIPGQSFASIGPGRIVSLSAALDRDREAWQVPVDFLRQALGPALNQRVEVRRASHVILMGDLRLPEISGRFERQTSGGRLTLEITPATPHRVTRENNRLIVRFDAVAVDFTPVPGLVPEFVGGVRADGASLVVELGPSAGGFRADDPDATHLTIEIAAPGAAVAAPPPLPVRPQAPDPPPLDLEPPGAIRTVVIDPGHGGEDGGAHGQEDSKEKDTVLQIARRLKAAIETRLGIRVLLTRNADEDVVLDRRMSLANNNKADLFISLHANASFRPETHGAQVLTLDAGGYRSRVDATAAKELPVPMLGGGSRSVDTVPWDLAQVPFAAKSAAAGALLVRHLTELGVPLYQTASVQLPLRNLVGANMPAVMLEMGFLTNADDQRGLADPDRSNAIIEALMATIIDMRGGAVR